jgi:hypothetical protein
MSFNSTITRKKKTCKTCNLEKYIYARGNCLDCDKKETPFKHGIKTDTEKNKKRKRIPYYSKKMLDELKIYRPLRDEFMQKNPICQFKGCSKLANDLHHKARRKENLCNVETFMSVCREHHNWIEENHAESVRLGYLI